MLINKYVNEVWELVNKSDFSLSFSSISALLESPLEFYKYVAKRNFYTQEETEIYNKETDALKMGKAIDEYIFGRLHPLSNGEFSYFFESERVNGATKEGKAKREIWAKEFALQTGKDVSEYKESSLNFDSFIDVQNMSNSIQAHSFANTLIFDSATSVQQKISFRTEENILIRGILDVKGFNAHPDIGTYIADLKKMPQAGKRFLSYQVFDRLLHLQAYIYIRCFAEQSIEIDNYFLVVVTDSGALNVVRLQPKHIQMGKELFDFALNRFVFEILSSPLNELSLLQSYPPKQGFIELF